MITTGLQQLVLNSRNLGNYSVILIVVTIIIECYDLYQFLNTNYLITTGDGTLLSELISSKHTYCGGIAITTITEFKLQ